jgi:hypothetical protein
VSFQTLVDEIEKIAKNIGFKTNNGKTFAFGSPSSLPTPSTCWHCGETQCIILAQIVRMQYSGWMTPNGYDQHLSYWHVYQSGNCKVFTNEILLAEYNAKKKQIYRYFEEPNIVPVSSLDGGLGGLGGQVKWITDRILSGNDVTNEYAEHNITMVKDEE